MTIYCYFIATFSISAISQIMSSANSVVSIQVTFVRHGQTDYNLKHISQGQTDVPLNEKGLNQAILAGKSLSQIHFDIIYSSDLSRAYKTAETIEQENKVIQTTCNIVPEILLREMSHGIYENKPNSAGKEAAEAAGFSHTDRRKFRPPGGENQDPRNLLQRLQLLSKNS